MNYFKHLCMNWKVATHALTDFFAHFIHGIFPFIEIKHHQPVIIKNKSEVEERKHGQWEEDEDKDIYCTNCKHFLYPAEIRMQQITLSSRRLKRKFCPECGAIMDEVNEDER